MDTSSHIHVYNSCGNDIHSGLIGQHMKSLFIATKQQCHMTRGSAEAPEGQRL